VCSVGGVRGSGRGAEGAGDGGVTAASKKLRNLYCTSHHSKDNVTERHVERMREWRNVYSVLVGNAKGRDYLEQVRQRTKNVTSGRVRVTIVAVEKQ
jgi:hypothetical protein